MRSRVYLSATIGFMPLLLGVGSCDSKSSSGASLTYLPTHVNFAPATSELYSKYFTWVGLEFDQDMDAATLVPANVSVSCSASGSYAVSQVVYNQRRAMAYLDLVNDPGDGETCTVTLANAIKDNHGAALEGTTQASFRLAKRPLITSQFPAAGGTGVALNAALTVAFSEEMNADTINTSTFTLETAAGQPVSANVTYDGTTHVATLTPLANLEGTTTFRARVSDGITDAESNHLASGLTWTFTTQDLISYGTYKWLECHPDCATMNASDFSGNSGSYGGNTGRLYDGSRGDTGTSLYYRQWVADDSSVGALIDLTASGPYVTKYSCTTTFTADIQSQTLMGSDDGTTWTSIATPDCDGTLKTITSTKKRYWRLKFLFGTSGVNGGTEFWLSDLRLYDAVGNQILGQ